MKKTNENWTDWNYPSGMDVLVFHHRVIQSMGRTLEGEVLRCIGCHGGMGTKRMEGFTEVHL